jgi:uncharacterized protein YgbK (DUF1537 family)
MPPILVIADDLSGAAEMAGLVFAHGLTAEVHTRFEGGSDAKAIVIDTDSRHLLPAEAARRVQTAMQQAGLPAGGWLYKKIDSLLRGNVRAEIEAAMQAAGLARAIVVPANPSRGRVIIGGQYFINGQPLDETPLACDPHHPRQTANVRSLLGDGNLPLHAISRNSPLPPGGIILPDVESRADLAWLAESVDQKTLAAGAADFFEAILVQRGHARSVTANMVNLAAPAVLVCGSRVAWADRKSACQQAGIPALIAEDFGTCPRDVRAVLLGAPEREIGPKTALRGLTFLAAQLIAGLPVRTVLVEGGETAAALVERLGWTRFRVVASVSGGVGALEPTSDFQPLVLIKPGSYPWPAEIWDAFLRLA